MTASTPASTGSTAWSISDGPTGTTATSAVVDRYGYTYDRNCNRLTRSNALAAAFSETYSYDALGNWTTVTTNGVDQTRTANAQNELTQVGSASLAYSTTGNLTTDAQGRTLVYDAWNRLVSVSNAAGTQVARYEYDGLNQRIVEQVGTTTVPAAASAAIRDSYYSQEWQVLEERVRDAGGAIPAVADTRYVWSPVYVDAMVARDRNADANDTTGTAGLEERVYALQDANWNATGIVAASGVPGVATGTVINRFAYTPYGESQMLTASWGTPAAGAAPITPWSHLFQGLKLTDVTGLAYVRHRDYSPTLGRFIERDPIGFEAGDGNWYRFVANGPTGRTDSSGLCECCAQLAVEIVVQAYIPFRRIPAPDGFYYTGDNRGLDATPGDENNDYRMRLHFADGKMKADAGVTRQYVSDDAPNPIAEAEDKEGAGMKHRAFAFGRQDRTAYRVEGVGKNPLIKPFSPYINYGFTIEVDNRGSTCITMMQKRKALPLGSC